MRTVQPINLNWNFRKDQPGEPWQVVSLPHTYNAVDGQDGSHMYRGPAVYTKTLNLNPQPGKSYYLEIGAASLACEVLVNGVSCASSTCGFAMFRVPLNGNLRDGENEITIQVTNGATTALYPAMADFSFYGGLYRTVSLVTDDAVHFSETDLSRDGIILKPEILEGETGRLTAECNVENEAGSDAVTVKLELVDACGKVAAAAELTAAPGKATLSVDLPNVHRWDGVEDPYLYTAVLTLKNGHGEVTDCRRIMTGFRTFAYSAQKGYLLNGKPIKLNGVARHQDFGGIGNAVTPETMALDMGIVKEVGANTLRLSHYQHPEEWYDLCDREGLLVWAEVPVISAVAQKAAADQNAFDQLERLIAQARNHCSIYCWGVQNEVCMGSNNSYTHTLVGKLAAFARKLDPSRMIAQANEYTTEDDCPILEHSDILGWNLYYGWYYGEIPDLQPRLDAIHAKHPDKPMMLTEYGVDTNVQFHSLQPKANDYSEEYQLQFLCNAIQAINERTFMAGGYVWNLFDFGSAGRDEGGTKGKNQKGLVTIDRKTKKDAFYLYKAHWSKEPFVYTAGRRFVNRPQEATTITILSNMEYLRLKVNGVPVGAKQADGAMTLFENVPLLPGENTVVAEASNADGTYRVDRITLCRVETPDESYKLKPKEKVVVDWFAGLDNEEFGIADASLRPEGFTFDDIIEDIFANERAKGIFLKFLRPLTLNPRFEGMMGFMNVTKLIEFANRDNSIPEALLRHCEQELNKIDK